MQCMYACMYLSMCAIIKITTSSRSSSIDIHVHNISNYLCMTAVVIIIINIVTVVIMIVFVMTSLLALLFIIITLLHSIAITY